MAPGSGPCAPPAVLSFSPYGAYELVLVASGPRSHVGYNTRDALGAYREKIPLHAFNSKVLVRCYGTFSVIESGEFVGFKFRFYVKVQAVTSGMRRVSRD
jgi:hypothetical protein